MSMQCQTRGALFITRRCLVYDGWMDAGCPGSVSSFNFGNVSPSLVTVTRRRRGPDTGTAPVRVTTSLSRSWSIIVCRVTPATLIIIIIIHNTWCRVLYIVCTKYSVYFIMRGPMCRYLPTIIWFILSLCLKTQSRTDCNTHTHNSPCKGCTK